MDILNPEIIVRGKRYYRSNLIVNNEAKTNISYTEYDEEHCDYEDIKSTFEITQHENEFRGCINVPSMFICFVIGKGGESKKRIEFDTQTVLTIPKMGSNGPITVKGKSSSAVDRALTRIAILIDIGREKSQFTHFLSIRINNNGIKSSFELFKDAVLHGCVGDRGVEESVFQRTYKLHVTICVMVLGDQSEIDNALQMCKLFQRENRPILSSPIKVHIRGIDCMNDDPCEVRVLYGKVSIDEESERLQTIADRIVDYLVDKRVILKKEYETVTLHMTLMNSNYNRDRDLELDNTDNRSKDQRTIDCSNIMKRFSDWDFGVLEVNEIELSKRHTVQMDSYYQRVGSLMLGNGGDDR